MHAYTIEMLPFENRNCQQCHEHRHQRQPDAAEQQDDDARTDRWAGAASNTGGGLARSLGVDLAPISPLELLNSSSGDAAEDLLPPDPPTVVINSEASPPTEKQKRIARVVMGVAFVLLATCVILVGVTLSMSDHIDDLVRKSHFHSGFIRQDQLHSQQAAVKSPKEDEAAPPLSSILLGQKNETVIASANSGH